MSEVAFMAGYMAGTTSGASKATVDTLIAILLAGHQVTVISHTGRRCRLPASIHGQMVPSPRWITPPRPFPRRPERQRWRRLAGWFLSAVQDPLWAARLRRTAPPDLTIVSAFNHRLLKMAGRIQPLLESKKVMVVHGCPREEAFAVSGLNVQWAVDAMSEYDHLVFVSSRCRDLWLSFPSLSDKPSFYIPNCCREAVVRRLLAQDHAHVRRRLGFEADSFVAVCVASIQHRKGQDLLLDRFSDLLAAVPNLKMVLVGPINTAWGEDLRRQVQSSPFAQRLRMLGARSNAMDYIYAADLFVLPSRAEAMPLAILEAMALKTPVVASNIDGIPELIEHGRSAFLFSHEQPEGLVESVRRMAKEPELRRAFAERACERYWANFSQEQQIRRYREALEVMLS